MNLKKLLTWAGVGLLVYALIVQPGQSAGVVNSVFSTLKGAAQSVMAFVQAVFA